MLKSSFIVQLLTFLSILNAAYTFLRKRHYRLFESSIDSTPTTPSAHRVRVDSSPISSSPLRFLSNILTDTSAESRAHPDATRDVWELAVWDPLPVCLRLFCMFSPGHTLVYWLFLPTRPSDPRPSTTIATTLFLEILLSAQLLLLQTNFSQQTKDSALIHKEVLNEYDVKYVHPRLNGPVRDVGTQFDAEYTDDAQAVDTYNPTTILKRGFRTNPNPHYAKHIDPDHTGLVPVRTVLTPNPAFRTPIAQQYRGSSAVRKPLTAIKQPQFRSSTGGAVSSGTNTGDGGSLGVFSHSNSPLKKASSFDASMRHMGTPKNNLEMVARERAMDKERSRSPAKRPREMGGESLTRRALTPRGSDPMQGIERSGPEYRRSGAY